MNERKYIKKKLDEIVSSTPLSAVELSYQAIQKDSTDLDQNPSPKEEYDPYISPICAINTTSTQDLFVRKIIHHLVP